MQFGLSECNRVNYSFYELCCPIIYNKFFLFCLNNNTIFRNGFRCERFAVGNGILNGQTEEGLDRGGGLP